MGIRIETLRLIARKGNFRKDEEDSNLDENVLAEDLRDIMDAATIDGNLKIVQKVRVADLNEASMEMSKAKQGYKFGISYTSVKDIISLVKNGFKQ